MMFAWIAPYVPYYYEEVRIITPITVGFPFSCEHIKLLKKAGRIFLICKIFYLLGELQQFIVYSRFNCLNYEKSDKMVMNRNFFDAYE